jgi:hypothetical protein
MGKTVVVTLTDVGYFSRAKRTIIDTRSRGEWTGDLVLITVGFDAPKNFLDYYNVIQKRVEHINTDYLVEQYKKFPLKTVGDNRHLLKLSQWDKFYVFDEYFKNWEKVIFFDAGLRVFDKVSILDNIDCKGSILAPDDVAQYDTEQRFKIMFEFEANIDATEKLFQEFPTHIIEERYFLNCIWIYDTSLLEQCKMSEMVEAMNKYPICRCNEMTIMNLLFTMKYKVWKPFPEFIENGKRLFGWIEYDRDYGPNKSWRDFCFMKYSQTINFECE